MTDPHDQLTALHTLATEWPGGIEKCPWWVKGFFMCGIVSDQHTLDIITANAERWLVGKGWRFERERDITCYTPDDYTIKFYTLPEALKYAQGQA